MFRFAQRSGPMTRSRRRNHQLTCEALETRQLLSGFYITNAASGLVLTDPEFKTSNAKIELSRPDEGANQQWSVESVQGIRLIKNAFSNKYLTDPGFSRQNGTKIIQDGRNDAADQEWNLIALVDGNVEVENVFSHKVLFDPGSPTHNGTPVEQHTYTGGANQQWKLVPF